MKRRRTEKGDEQVKEEGALKNHIAEIHNRGDHINFCYTSQELFEGPPMIKASFLVGH